MDGNTVFPSAAIKITPNVILPSKKLSYGLVLFCTFLITSHFEMPNFALMYYWVICSVLKTSAVLIPKCFPWCISTTGGKDLSPVLAQFMLLKHSPRAVCSCGIFSAPSWFTRPGEPTFPEFCNAFCWVGFEALWRFLTIGQITFMYVCARVNLSYISISLISHSPLMQARAGRSWKKRVQQLLALPALFRWQPCSALPAAWPGCHPFSTSFVQLLPHCPTCLPSPFFHLVKLLLPQSWSLKSLPCYLVCHQHYWSLTFILPPSPWQLFCSEAMPLQAAHYAKTTNKVLRYFSPKLVIFEVTFEVFVSKARHWGLSGGWGVQAEM